MRNLSELLSRPPSPKQLLRCAIFVCLVLWGISLIAVVSHPGSLSLWYQWTRQLASDMFAGLLSFGFLYAQYVCVERYFQRDLEPELGYVQAFGCVAAIVWVLLGYVIVLLGQSDSVASVALSTNAIVFILVFGEAAFLANILWSYLLKVRSPAMQQPIAVAQVPLPAIKAPLSVPAPRNTAVSAQPKPNGSHFDSPEVAFSIGAGFFLVMGTIFVTITPLVTRMPLWWNGRLIFVASGYLWMPLALPFAAFAAAYWLLAHRRFTRSATRINFFCTVLVVIESARVYVSWASTVANSSAYRTHITGGSLFGVSAFSLLAIASFLWNFYASSDRGLSHRAPVRPMNVKKTPF